MALIPNGVAFILSLRYPMTAWCCVHFQEVLKELPVARELSGQLTTSGSYQGK